MLTLNDGRNELWQWDTGRKLTVDAECSQVHFSNKVFGRSIDVDVVDGIAIIPDILLQTDKELTAWAFVGTAENGYTKISKAFKVNRRNKPADYVFTPHDQTTLGEIVQRLEELEAMQDPDAIRDAVDEYLANNPIEVEETDPTVPDWAKQPEPPKVEIPEINIPTTLPNPHALHLTGAVEATYDGSKAVEVVIPQGGGGKEWKLIWEKTFTEADLGTAFWEFTLDTPAEEIVVIDTNLRSEQAMGWHIKVNGLSVSTNAPYLTDDTKNRNRQTYCSYKGDVWKVDIGEYGYDALGMGAINAVDTGPGAYTVVGKLPTVGKATSIRFAQSIQQNYQVFSGSVRMYVR